MKIIIKHPHIEPKHAKHTAAGLTIAGGIISYTPFSYLEAVLFAIAGCLAIYEPYIVHEVDFHDHDQ